MAVYTFNVTASNALDNVEFWKKVIKYLDDRPRLKVDMMLGLQYS